MGKINYNNMVGLGLGVAASLLCPAAVGAALVGGAIAGAIDNSDTVQGTLERAFVACRLGVLQRNGNIDLPKMIFKHRRPYGWRFGYSIPKGLSIIDFLNKKMAIQTAIKGEVELWEQDGILHLRAMTLKLPKKIDFKPFEVPEKMIIPIPIGYSRRGLEIADLAELPHLLVGGTTGAGKSVFLHGVTFTLCHYPHVNVYVIDLKKIEFVHYSDHVTLATTLQDAFALISSIRQEMYRRMDLLMNARKNNIRKHKEYLPFIVLVIDEFAQMWPQNKSDSKASYDIKKKCHNYLHDILSLARAVGISCILSTQRPDRFIMPGQLKGNLPATLAFRCRDMTNATVLDTPLAALIPAELKGRAIWNYENDREIQVMMFDPERAIFPPPRKKQGIVIDDVCLTGVV